jgi:hypothetical protein
MNPSFNEDDTDAGKPPVLSKAWWQEVARRSAEYDAGQAETVSWQEVQARWHLRSHWRQQWTYPSL